MLLSLEVMVFMNKKNIRQPKKIPPAKANFELSSALKDRALASAAEGITISDISLPDNPLIYVNSGFEQMTGYSAHDVLGKNCRFLQGVNTDKTAAEEIRQAIRQERPCVTELLNYRKDGSVFWNRLSITPVKNNQGQTTHFVGVQSDITQRREAQEALLKTKEQIEGANKEMKKALHSAAVIQEALLPARPICTSSIHIEGRMIACDELAGDIFNYFWLDATHLGCYVLDVVGHGVSAALLSVTLSHFLSPVSSKSCVFSSVLGESNKPVALPAWQVAEELNKVFRVNEKTVQFFTILYGIFDTEKNTFQFVSAGHPCLICQSADGTTRAQYASGYPIGLSEKPEYKDTLIYLQPGDRLFVYSDGLTETQNAQGQMLGENGLIRILDKYRNLTIHKTLNSIIDDVSSYSGQTRFKDDVSILALQVKHPDTKNRP
jgi:PAS domain S-box-containing protein